jgi:dipeptidyl aminopeptidase/acylaminoacyl peptidase
MRTLSTVMACVAMALLTGCAAMGTGPQAAASSHAPPGRPAARAGDPIAVTGITLKTDIAAVCTSHPDGTMQYQLPLSAAVLPATAAWSPDGKQLAIDAAGTIFVIGADGRGYRQLAREETQGTVSWSPDGKWIAFINEADGYFSAAYAIHPDGTGLHQVLKGFNVESLAWGPGDRIAFFGSPYHPVPPSASPTQPPAGLWTADGNGTHATQVAGPSKSMNTWLLAWSPDGRLVLFSDGSSLIDVPAAGGRPRVLLTAPSSALVAAAAWSPDGGTIIVAVNPPEVSGVAPVRYYRIPAAGGHPTAVNLPPMRHVTDLAWAAG